MGGKKKINQNEGHRFALRDRSAVQREVYTPTVPQKRDYEALSSMSSSEYSDNNINAFDFDLDGLSTIPFQLPKAKTQVNRKHKTSSHKWKQKTSANYVIPKLLDEMIRTIETGDPSVSNSSMSLDCNIRYMDLDFVAEKFGFFDILCVDPPWRLYASEPGTLSKQEIMDIPLEKLSRKGFCFLWAPSKFIRAGYECLNKWGYDCVDHLIWIKTTSGSKRAKIEEGSFFYHSSERCLIGYKCPAGEKVEFRSKVSNDLIIADMKENCQKPEQLYTVIELMMPGSKKIEVFGGRQKLKKGWLSIGTQHCLNRAEFLCCECQEPIQNFRYKKSKKNLCETCADTYDFKLNLTLNYVHHFYDCQVCGLSPISGVRFQCLQCSNKQMCEKCYDKDTFCEGHPFDVHEAPPIADSLPLHYSKKCIKCGQKPIIGPCYVCTDCSFLVMCSNCYFHTTFKEFDSIEGHDTKHKLEVITNPKRTFKQSICQSCGKTPLVSPKYICEVCFNYELCEHCYIRRDSLNLVNGAHIPSHNFYSY